jgi:ribosome-binding protein aMBF1 (putative translation factor)
MITNERQHRITKAGLRKFDEALTDHDRRQPGAGVDPRVHAAMGDTLRSEREELRRQLTQYERLRAGHVKGRSLRSLSDVPRVLIDARVATHVTQKTLADRLSVAEQQIQRWEATDYSGVSLTRIQEVADALGVKITEKVTFKPSVRARGSARSAARPEARQANRKDTTAA